MTEGEPPGVQELSREAVPRSVSVARIAANRMPDRGEVSANLVRSTGLQGDLHERVRGQQLDDLEVRTSRPLPPTAYRHPLARAMVAADRSVDRSAP